MSNIWFISDLHLSHANILRFCSRPFDTIREHDEALVTNWNSVVSHTDSVYILGDIGMCSEGYVLSILNRLNGKLYLIKGNHDKVVKKEKVAARFEWIKEYYELPIQGLPEINSKIVLCHYPFESWNKSCHGSYHLHGHVHSRFDERNKTKLRHDVGVDSNNYTPVSLRQIIDIMKNKNFDRKNQQ